MTTILVSNLVKSDDPSVKLVGESLSKLFCTGFQTAKLADPIPVLDAFITAVESDKDAVKAWADVKLSVTSTRISDKDKTHDTAAILSWNDLKAAVELHRTIAQSVAAIEKFHEKSTATATSTTVKAFAPPAK